MDTTQRRLLVLLGAVALLVVVGGVAAYVADDEPDDATATGLTLRWGGSEGHPSCAYDEASGTVAATITIVGEAPRPDTVAITVTAYADENTSRLVGSGTREVPVDGAVDTSVVVTVPVDKAPHVDEDDEAACRLEPLSVDY